MKSDIQYELTGPSRRLNSIVEAYFKFRESAQLAQQRKAENGGLAEAPTVKQALAAKKLIP